MIGLILLRTRFPRPLGDGGNASSWPEPVAVATLERARVANVVVNAPLPQSLCDDIARAAQALASQGARCVTTSCGFLASIQMKIAPQVSVPFVSSSLCLLPHFFARGVTPDQIGVLTFDAETLGARHYAGVGVAPDQIPAAQFGLLAQSHLRACIANDETELNLARAQAEVVSRAQALKAAHPRVTTLILECTNLAPYRVAMEAATGCKTFTIRDAVERLCPMPR
jgi:hypothetical protein